MKTTHTRNTLLAVLMNSLCPLNRLLWLCILLGFTLTTDAQTPICGNITTTTWTSAGNPYIIGCDSTVLSGNTLTIQPGVIVWLGSNVTLTVNGLIQAVGTPTQRIAFRDVVPSQPWNAISLINASTNRFKYCNFQNANTFLQMTAYSGAGKIEIKYCDFQNANTAISMGVYGGNSTRVAEVMNCTFSNCISQAIYGEAQGTAGCCYYHEAATLNPIIENCAFYSMSNGCVMRISGQVDAFSNVGYGYANPRIIGNVFQNLTGTAFFMGIGSYAGSGSPIFLNNTLVNCRTGVDSREPWNVRIQDNIFVGATNGVKKTGSLSLTTSYNDFYGNATNFTGYPANFGQPIIPNCNGTLADLFFNIFEDPQFLGANDFHLAINSPCIDACMPDTAFCDLCLSNNPSQRTQVPDMGAYGGPDACNWLTDVPVLPVAAAISKSNNVIRVNWGAIPRSEYQVQYLTNFALVGTNGWLNFTNGRVLATEKPTALVVATSNTKSNAFFRIQSLGRTPGN